MYQIDQSIRIEQTNKDTIIGLASPTSHKSFTLIIPARIKRQIQERYRRLGLSKKYMVDLFVASIILTIKRSKFIIHELHIDQEYPGHETSIISEIEKYCQERAIVSISTIGKRSPAHHVAYGVYLHKTKANARATLSDILTVIQKKDRGL